ncbi:hypothetical protein AAIH46_09740 [Rhizobium sp. 0TCS1.26]|jgi:hypothetical protein|uniref:hypothetical protein n=1 Tax=Rhizobium sp. 0TCS1.26 TaxID=3142623 RepID=UPI003D2C4DF9
MTDLLKQAIERIRALPDEQQDEVARVLLRIVDAESEPVALSQGDRLAIERSKAAAARGEFASDDEVRAAWASFGR